MSFISHLLLGIIIFHAKGISSSEINSVSDRNEQWNICKTDICAIDSARILNTLNDTAAPCDDFYEFACGKLIRNTRLPDTKDSQTVFSDLQEIVDAQVKSILLAEPAPNETKATKLAQIFNQACINDGIHETKGG